MRAISRLNAHNFFFLKVASAPLSFDNAKVQHFLPDSKFSQLFGKTVFFAPQLQSSILQLTVDNYLKIIYWNFIYIIIYILYI